MTGYATYLNVGCTCGQQFGNNDYVAAIASNYWTSLNFTHDPMCKQSVRVTDLTTGKSVDVAIKDKCPTCNNGDIVLSPIAFKQLQNLDVGSFKVTWNFLLSPTHGRCMSDFYLI